MSKSDLFGIDSTEDKNNYTFSFSGDERNIRFNVSVDDFDPWDDVLKHFVDFLGAVYGYNISKYVEVTAPHMTNGKKDDEDTSS